MAMNPKPKKRDELGDFLSQYEAYFAGKGSRELPVLGEPPAAPPVVVASKKSVQGIEVVKETQDGRITVLKLSADAKAGLSTDGAQIRLDKSQTTVQGIEVVKETQATRLARSHE